MATIRANWKIVQSNFFFDFDWKFNQLESGYLIHTARAYWLIVVCRLYFITISNWICMLSCFVYVIGCAHFIEWIFWHESAYRFHFTILEIFRFRFIGVCEWKFLLESSSKHCQLFGCRRYGMVAHLVVIIIIIGSSFCLLFMFSFILFHLF